MKTILTENQKTGFVVITLIMAGFIAYANSFQVPFYFDDVNNIKHPSLRLEELSIESIKGALTEGTMRSRPVSNLSFALNYYFGEFRVQGYHLVNLLVHISAGVFLFLLIKLTLAIPAISWKYPRKNSIAFFTALLWLVHPVGTQSVTYIVQRMNSMAAMFFVLSLLFYAYGRKLQIGRLEVLGRGYVIFVYILSLLSGLLALGSKEIAATLPLIIFLYEWFFFQDLSLSWLRKKAGWIATSLGGVLLFAWIYTGGHLLQRTVNGFAGRDFSLEERLFTQLRVVVHYLSLLIYPHPERLVFDYDFSISTSFLSPSTTLYSGVFLFSLILIGAIVARRERLISFCICWFFINLLVESTIVPLEMVYEHRTYLPAMMFVLIIVSAIYSKLNNRYIISTIMTVICVIMVSWTLERNEMWLNPIKFWNSSLHKYPNDFRVYVNLGQIYADQGELITAEKNFRKAIEIKPEAVEVYNNLGVLLVKLGKVDEAEKNFSKALDRDKKYSPALLNLAKVLVGYEKYDKAEALLETLLRNELDNEHRVEVLSLLGGIYLKNNKYTESLKLVDQALEYTSLDYKLHLLRAEVMMRLGKVKDAIKTYERVLELRYSNSVAHYNLARLLIEQNKQSFALHHYNEASRYNPKIIPVDYNYANTLLRMGRYNGAKQQYMKYITSMTNIADVYNNLGLSYLNLGELEKARHAFRIAYTIEPENRMAKRNFGLAQELISNAME